MFEKKNSGKLKISVKQIFMHVTVSKNVFTKQSTMFSDFQSKAVSDWPYQTSNAV